MGFYGKVVYMAELCHIEGVNYVLKDIKGLERIFFILFKNS